MKSCKDKSPIQMGGGKDEWVPNAKMSPIPPTMIKYKNNHSNQDNPTTVVVTNNGI
jgi:hypothetical protein